MTNIIIFYIICILFSILITIKYIYPSFFSNKIKEGNTNQNEDKCEYKLHVDGMVDHIARPELNLFGMNILEPIAAIVDMINDIIDVINKIIIAIDFFVTKFIKCLFFYILDAIGKILWGLIMAICKFFSWLLGKINIDLDLGSYVDMAYKFLNDNVDTNLYYYTGLHIMHFPTIIQNRCYHVFGDGRIPCWVSPFGSNNKEGATGVSDNSAQNAYFYEILRNSLIALGACLLLYCVFAYIMSNFAPDIKCEGPSCK
jgi:hypothetical protein